MPNESNGQIHFEFKGCCMAQSCVAMYNFIQILKIHSLIKQCRTRSDATECAEPDHMPHSVVSDLVLHCLSMPHEMDTRLIWVNGGDGDNCWTLYMIFTY